ncbi:hypothetical protein EWB00_005873 [Schistosoma japonicum]|uniref:Uncharacterized protein n=1 Tax=Schistosoma japonicum TaxID=6182 RepID=A0A4Z2D055_SCHJA|nr:hypothetical protein EWB00_005873 [Schistosoma japonicum]
MYIVLRKLNHYQIKPYTTCNQSITHIPSYYYIITPMISSEKTETNIESSKSKDFTDQYELFRSNEHVEMKSQLDQWNFISTVKICQVIFSTVLQECLNAALLNDSGQLIYTGEGNGLSYMGVVLMFFKTSDCTDFCSSYLDLCVNEVEGCRSANYLEETTS